MIGDNPKVDIKGARQVRRLETMYGYFLVLDDFRK